MFGPVRVGVLPQQRRRAGGPVGGQDLHPALVAALHHDQRIRAAPVVPAHGHEIGERRPVPLHRSAPARQVGQHQRHVGVGRARRRIGDLHRAPPGIGRVGDVPALDRRLVDPRDEQRGAVRRPPVTPGPVHLLGGDEFGQPVGDARVVLGPGHRPVRTRLAAQGRDAHAAAAHVGHPLSRRIRPRVQRRGLKRQLPRRRRAAGFQVHRENPARQAEHGRPQRRVHRVRHDAAGLLAHSLPASLLLRRQIVVPGRGEHGRVGDQPFGAAAHVKQPQAGQRVGAGPAAQEQEPVPGGGDGERARYAQGESPGSGLLPGEAFGHGNRSCQPRLP